MAEPGCTSCVEAKPSNSQTLESTSGSTRLQIPMMDCPTEEAIIRRALDTVSGIRLIDFELSARSVDLEGSATSVDQAIAAIKKAGFEAHRISATGEASETHADPSEV